MKKLGIYIHIPYCLRKCPYCGFYSRGIGDVDDSKVMEETKNYVGRIAREIKAEGKSYPDHQVDSIFIGGGTPSILEPDSIELLVHAVRESFNVTGDCEVSIEVNPGVVNVEKLKGYINAGINRISIGVQSFNDDVLKTLGRIHNSRDAEQVFRDAREAGFMNINLDLMFGIPYQSMEDWVNTLEKAISLNPEHLSVYSLQIEEGTPYYESFMAGSFDELPDEVDRAMYHRALEILKSAGYKHYEISNGAKVGFECRHNLKYWTGEEYLGFGDSSSSYVNHCRYIQMNGEKQDYHENTLFDDMSEFAFTELRLRSGLSYSAFYRRFGMSPREAFADRWEELREFFDSGALIEYVTNEGEPASLVITEKGIDISNRIMAVFV